MSDLTCDVAIIGAGTAGRAAERSARRHGAKTLLIDETFSATTCARVGCMPSKLLIAAADAAHAARRAEVFGISAQPQVDGHAVMVRLQKERQRFMEGDCESLELIPEEVRIKARARFNGPTRLELDDGRAVEAKAVVIATGASPQVPKAFEAVAERVLTTDTLFDLTTLPRSLGVIGAGPVGLELAQACARLGVEVMLFDKDKVLGGCRDEEVNRDLRTILGHEFPIVLGVEIEAKAHDDGVLLTWHGIEDGQKLFQHLLVATGRPPRLDGLNLEATGLALDDHGTPFFDAGSLQCGSSPVFIAGDANHDRPVLHEAADEGTVAGRNAATFPQVGPSKRSVPMAMVFTDPPLAVIGETPKEDDQEAITGKSSYEDQGRARTMARNVGRAHIHAERATGRIIGATLACPGAEHMAHLLAWSIDCGHTATELLDLPFYHPTLEEGLKSALRDICRASGTVAPGRSEASMTGG